MYSEVSNMHMIRVCEQWAQDEDARSLWSDHDVGEVFKWCKSQRGRLPNLDKLTSGGGQLFKLIQARASPLAACPPPSPLPSPSPPLAE